MFDRYAKAIVGGVIAGLGAIGTALADGSITAQEYVTAGIAFFAALALVWGYPNATDSSR